MNALAALRYAPGAPSVEQVALVPDGKDLVVVTSNDRYVFARASMHVDAPLTGLPCRLHAPDGSMIETDAADAITAWYGKPDRIARAASMLESHWWTVIALACVTALTVWLMVTYAMPLLARPVATQISPQAERMLGQRALATLDRLLASRTTLDVAEQQRIRTLVLDFMQGEPEQTSYALEFRRLAGPNAVALPGSIIVITDELVHFVGSDEELLAVIAHEMGHARGRHATRLMLQQSGVAVLMTAIAGDAVGVTILAAAVPSMLLNARYSRALESEADAYAVDHLRRHGISPQAFADVLRRFAAKLERDAGRETAMAYASSHPPTAERIERAEQAAARN